MVPPQWNKTHSNCLSRIEYFFVTMRQTNLLCFQLVVAYGQMLTQIGQEKLQLQLPILSFYREYVDRPEKLQWWQ